MEGRRQLALQTVDLTAGFMVWVALSSLLPSIRQDIAIPAEQVGLVTAVPVVLGSVLRVPMGYWAGLFGARTVFLASFAALIAPVWFLSEASMSADLLVGGVFLGIAGAVFSVGVTSLPKYFPSQRHGFVNGVYGFGNMGTALSTWLAPVAAAAIGWRGAMKLYLVLLGALVVLNLALGDHCEPRVRTPILRQLRALAGDAQLWALSLFYFVTFGAFVALTVYLPSFLTSYYGLGETSAGAATSAFVVVAATVRVLGGWLGDRLDCYGLLAGAFAALALGAGMLAAAPGLPAYLAGVYLVGIACGIGNGAVFKLVPLRFAKHAGPANGIVSMMGGLGGFFPPLVLSASMSAFGTNAPGLAAFGVFATACLAAALVMRRRGSGRAA